MGSLRSTKEGPKASKKLDRLNQIYIPDGGYVQALFQHIEKEEEEFLADGRKPIDIGKNQEVLSRAQDLVKVNPG